MTKELTIAESDCWKHDLRHLMQEFCIPDRVIKRIIHTVEYRTKPNVSCIEAYQRGWFMFKEYLLQQ